MDNSVVLSVGDSHHIRLGKDRIVYAGMPSEKVFSIAQMKSWICLESVFPRWTKQNKNRWD